MSETKVKKISKIRSNYRKKIVLAVVISLVVGIGAGIIIDRVFLPDMTLPASGSVAATKAPEEESAPIEETEEVAAPTEDSEVPAGFEATGVDEGEAAAEPTEQAMTLEAAETTEAAETEAAETETAVTETAVPQATEAPAEAEQVIIVPFDTEYTFTSEILSDGKARTSAAQSNAEQIIVTMHIKRNLSDEYYAETYGGTFDLKGNEAGVEMEIYVNNYLGAATLDIDKILNMTVETRDGKVVNTYKFRDAEIQGNSGLILTTNVPMTVYKRFDYDAAIGDAAYLCVTTFNGDVTRILKFELGEPIRPTPTPEATKFYPTLEKGSDYTEEVTSLQQRLIELGYLDGEADGKFGSGTQSAIKKAQAAFDMEEDGIASHDFQVKLFADDAPKYETSDDEDD